MPVSDIPILSMLRTRMQWHQERQRVLAENVANADTPGFRPNDLKEPTFETTPGAALGLVRTAGNHLDIAGGTSRFDMQRNGGYEIRPAGNAVSLEDEMMKVAQNQMDFQTAAQIYSQGLALIKTALGRK